MNQDTVDQIARESLKVLPPRYHNCTYGLRTDFVPPYVIETIRPPPTQVSLNDDIHDRIMRGLFTAVEEFEKGKSISNAKVVGTFEVNLTPTPLALPIAYELEVTFEVRTPSRGRFFKVGDKCLHKGFICRVDAITPNERRGYNPKLTLTALFSPNNVPVAKAKTRVVSSGSVETVESSIHELKHKIAAMQGRLALLEP